MLNIVTKLLTTVASACGALQLCGPPYQSELDKKDRFFFAYGVINIDVHFKMFRYNPKANYQPNEFQYLQILSGKDLYKQEIVISDRNTFPARFPNIIVDYPLGEIKVGDKLWTNWNKAPLRLWQMQLNFAVWCTLSTCGVSSEHLNYAKHPMVRAVFRFHVYYHVRRA